MIPLYYSSVTIRRFLFGQARCDDRARELEIPPRFLCVCFTSSSKYLFHLFSVFAYIVLFPFGRETAEQNESSLFTRSLHVYIRIGPERRMEGEKKKRAGIERMAFFSSFRFGKGIHF